MENQTKAEWYSKPSWTVWVLYENPQTRNHAARYCDELVEKFWSECGFEIGWLGFHELSDPFHADRVAENVSGSDLIVVAAEPEGQLPDLIVEWLQQCLGRRGQREGAVVGLLDPCSNPECRESISHATLRRLAHAAGLDYLTAVPPSLAEKLPETPDSYTERAHEMSGLMNEILMRPAGPLRGVD